MSERLGGVSGNNKFQSMEDELTLKLLNIVTIHLITCRTGKPEICKKSIESCSGANGQYDAGKVTNGS